MNYVQINNSTVGVLNTGTIQNLQLAMTTCSPLGTRTSPRRCGALLKPPSTTRTPTPV
jgi:hypothetical protein